MLTIGEFSRLTRTTPRMLRHYDALGLLHPDTVGENGYRYYRQEQLSDLVRIQWLSGYGFALHEIGPLLGLEDGALLSRLHQRREALRRELEQRGDLLRRLEADILRMEGVSTMETTYHVILVEDPEQKVFSIRRTTGVEGYHQLFEDLRREAAARASPRRGPSRCSTTTRTSTRSAPTWRPRWWWPRRARASRSSPGVPALRSGTGAPMTSSTLPTRPCARGLRSTRSTAPAARPWTGT